MTASILAWHRARPKLAIGVHALLCAALLGIAFIAQYFYDQHPCELCLWQRVPYAVVMAVSLAALFKDNKWTPWILTLIAILYAMDCGIAAHHLGVERHWWGSAVGCGFQATAADIKELYEKIKTAPIVACDQPTWFFLGVSMAGWNVIVAALLTVFSAAQAWVQRLWWTTRQRG